MSELKDKLLKAIFEIDFDNLGENQKSTLEKALVMIQTKWNKNNDALNIKMDNIVTLFPIWNWGFYDYSIIPEKKTVSLDFSDADRLRDVWIKRKNKVAEFKILGLNDIGVYLFDVFLRYQELQKNYTFLDGTLIEKEV